MINLLPPSYKKNILMEKRWKSILNLEIFISAFLICAFLIVLTVRIAVNGLAEAQSISTNIEEANLRIEESKTEGISMKDLEMDIRDINKSTTEVNSFFGQKRELTLILDNFSQIIPQDSYLTSFSYQKESSKVFIAGSCPDRERMLELKEGLEKREDVKNISFPSSNWLSPDKFSINFEIND
jgi:hypothetical protein